MYTVFQARGARGGSEEVLVAEIGNQYGNLLTPRVGAPRSDHYSGERTLAEPPQRMAQDSFRASPAASRSGAAGVDPRLLNYTSAAGPGALAPDGSPLVPAASQAAIGQLAETNQARIQEAEQALATLQAELQSRGVSVPGAQMTPQAVQAELQRLQGQLSEINQDLEALMQQLPPVTQPQASGQTLAPAVTGGATGVEASGVASGGTYVVRQGDYLRQIAENLLGDRERYREIYDLNRDVIGSNPDLIHPGIVLRLPAGASTPVGPVPPSPVTQRPVPPVVTPPSNPAAPPGWQPISPIQPVVPGTPPQIIKDLPGVKPSTRPMNDAEMLQRAQMWGLVPPSTTRLTPEAQNNVRMFEGELESYQTIYRGNVLGPDLEVMAQQEGRGQDFKEVTTQVQKALDILIQSGRLRVVGADGVPSRGLQATGSYFKLDGQGGPIVDPNGKLVQDQTFIDALTQFKAQKGIHQSYRLADGSYAVNEYAGPGTVTALRDAVRGVRGGP